jgi:hypothetical protein
MKQIFNNWRHFLNESTGDIFKPQRNVSVEFNPQEHPEIDEELFDLIKKAYSEIGGHAKIKSPKDILKNTEWNYWVGQDIHNDPDFDLIIFGSKTPYGIKFSGIGHDGTKDAKRTALGIMSTKSNEIGHFMEVSGKMADIMIKKFGANPINDKEKVEKILGKSVKWIGHSNDQEYSYIDGWYMRKIGDHFHTKILVGKPNS